MIQDVIYSLFVLIETLPFFNKQLQRLMISLTLFLGKYLSYDYYQNSLNRFDKYTISKKRSKVCQSLSYLILKFRRYASVIPLISSQKGAIQKLFQRYLKSKITVQRLGQLRLEEFQGSYCGSRPGLNEIVFESELSGKDVIFERDLLRIAN